VVETPISGSASEERRQSLELRVFGLVERRICECCGFMRVMAKVEGSGEGQVKFKHIHLIIPKSEKEKKQLEEDLG